MGKIFKNMIPYWKAIIIVIALLCVQAWCDLSLPAYTSDIIDVGIMSSGVEHVVPEAITAEEFELAKLFMTDGEGESWESCFELDGDIYYRSVDDEETLEELDEELIVPLLMNYQMSAIDEASFKESVAEQTGMDAAVLKDMSIEDVGAYMGVELVSFEKETEDDDGNEVKAAYVDMRQLFCRWKSPACCRRMRFSP